METAAIMRMKELVQKLDRAAKAYYQQDTEIISNGEIFLEFFSKGQEWGIALYFVRFYCMISNDRISFLSLILSKRRLSCQIIYHVQTGG